MFVGLVDQSYVSDFIKESCTSGTPEETRAPTTPQSSPGIGTPAPPNDRQLASAAWFFRHHRPRLLWTESEWRSQRKNENTSNLTPEVVFLGRSNVGKSSLLNALVEDPTLNKTGARPGLTTVMRAYSLSTEGNKARTRLLPPNTRPGQLLTVIDAPGYGHASRTEWGAEIVRYLQERKHLRRVFLLIDAMHGAKPADLQILGLLRQHAISHQVIATKCDRFEPPSKRRELLNQSLTQIQRFVQLQGPRSTFTGLGEIIAVGSLGSSKNGEKIRPDRMQGVSAVQYAVLRSAGLDDYAYSIYNTLDEAAQYDDSPTKPNAVWRPTALHADALKQTGSPSTQEASPSSIKEPIGASTSQRVSHTSTKEVFPGSTQEVSRTSNPEPTRGTSTQAVSRGMDAFLDAVVSPKSTAKGNHRRGPTPSRHRTRSKSTGRTEASDTLENLPKSMQDLLAASKSTKKRIGSTAEKRKKSKHANPFSN